MTTAAMEDSSKELLQSHVKLWHQSLCYVKSLALAVALDLRIPDAIHHHGGAATLAEILAKTALHPCKLRALRRLMRVLTVSGTFAVEQPATPAGGEAVYKLTAASRFLVGDETSLAPFLRLALRPISVSPHAAAICAWFRQDRPGPSVFGLVYRKDQTVWEQAGDANVLLNNGMAADSRFLMPIVLKECGEVFHGIDDSLVDVGGGLGGAAAAIAEAIPGLKCSVLDLPHVVADAPSDGHVQFIAGDMFQSIPPACAVFLKTTLHDWGDDECVKILKNCRQAIHPRDGGKVIIMDMVVGRGPSDIKHIETQVMFDFFIMMVDGVERDEQEWKRIFFEAGFKDYRVIPVLGVLSIIEVYP